MKFNLVTAEIFIPDNISLADGLRRTTHLAVAAHQDDLEMMASAPILACFEEKSKWFTGVVVTDGRSSPRAGVYKNYSDADMRLVRRREQKKAAVIGEYAAVVFLDYASTDLKSSRMQDAVADLGLVFELCKPEKVYTHNLADKHDTHVAVALGVIRAIRQLPENEKPEKLYGCEVWRDLDWLLDEDKVLFDLSNHENLQAALLGVFDTQIAGGKRYDAAILGRRHAHGTFYQPGRVDEFQSLGYGMDLTPLVENDQLDISEYIGGYIRRFTGDVLDRINRLEAGRWVSGMPRSMGEAEG